jgi:hypothetical protein
MRIRFSVHTALGADSEEKHEPVSDIDTVQVDSLKALDPDRPIREADIVHCSNLATDLEVEKAGKSFSQAASGAKYLT